MIPEDHTSTRHPLTAFIYLIVFSLAGTLIFSVLGLLVATTFYGTGALFKLSEGTTNVGFLKVLQIFSSIGTFLFPAWLFARSDNKDLLKQIMLKTPIYPLLFIITVVIMFSASPFLEWTQSLNQQMHLPDFLKTIENWMRKQEDELAVLTQKLLIMKSPADLSVNLLMIALLPALGEELLFRGCLQHIFTRWTKNMHWGIWIAAILFSAIHLQFYGFIPRMLLGALFGYLLLWSNNIWFPIWAHFLNNAVAVLTAYAFQLQGKPLQDLSATETISIQVCLISLFLSLGSIWIFYRYAKFKATSTITRNG